MSENTAAKAYWKKNLRYVAGLLIIWFTVSFGLGILFKENLDQITFGGFNFCICLPYESFR